jgi:predicted naringenin-chalcone synthase
VSVGRVDQLLTVTCTGYGTPGVDAALAAKLGLGEATTSVTLGHMGCHAALPGLGVAADAASARQRTVLLVCVELPSLHLQAPGTDLDQIVAHSLFADAAAAAVVTPGGPGWEVVDDASHTDRAWEEMLTWEVTDHGFRMGLSPRLPQVLAPRVAPLVDALLHRNRLRRSDVAGWAVHPGGPRVVDVVGDRLGLEAGQLEASRAVLTEHGNCSSPTVLMVLERLDCWHTAPPGTWVVAVAFGPGLTIHATLLQRNPGF